MKHGKNTEITTTPKQTIAGRKWDQRRRPIKSIERSHKTIGSDHNGTMSGKPGMGDSSSDAEKPTEMGN
jgi:hypothetical protein